LAPAVGGGVPLGPGRGPAVRVLGAGPGRFIWHGILHILTGYDHLLFVASLVLASRGLWDLIKVISTFTLAHTVTLTWPC